MVGCKLVMHVKELPNKKIASSFIIEKFPEYNFCSLTTEGVANNLDAPMWGGKCTITYNKTDKGYFSTVETEKMGKWTYDEEYTATGMKCVSFIKTFPIFGQF